MNIPCRRIQQLLWCLLLLVSANGESRRRADRHLKSSSHRLKSEDKNIFARHKGMPKSGKGKGRGDSSKSKSKGKGKKSSKSQLTIAPTIHESEFPTHSPILHSSSKKSKGKKYSQKGNEDRTARPTPKLPGTPTVAPTISPTRVSTERPTASPIVGSILSPTNAPSMNTDESPTTPPIATLTAQPSIGRTTAPTESNEAPTIAPTVSATGTLAPTGLTDETDVPTSSAFPTGTSFPTGTAFPTTLISEFTPEPSSSSTLETSDPPSVTAAPSSVGSRDLVDTAAPSIAGSSDSPSIAGSQPIDTAAPSITGSIDSGVTTAPSITGSLPIDTAAPSITGSIDSGVTTAPSIAGSPPIDTAAPSITGSIDSGVTTAPSVGGSLPIDTAAPSITGSIDSGITTAPSIAGSLPIDTAAPSITGSIDSGVTTAPSIAGSPPIDTAAPSITGSIDSGVTTAPSVGGSLPIDTAAPSITGSIDSGVTTAPSVGEPSVPTPDNINGPSEPPTTEGSGVKVTPFAIIYNTSSTAQPSEEDFAEVEKLTLEYIDQFLEQAYGYVDVFEYSNITGSATGQAFLPNRMGFEAIVAFDDKSETIPSQEDVDAILAVAFEPPQVDMFISMLKNELSETNPMSTTSSVVYSSARLTTTDSQGNQTLGIVMMFMGVCVLSLVLGAYVRAKRRNDHFGSGKKRFVTIQDERTVLLDELSRGSSSRNSRSQIVSPYLEDDQVVEIEFSGNGEALDPLFSEPFSLSWLDSYSTSTAGSRRNVSHR